jgi:hypothetical protein
MQERNVEVAVGFADHTWREIWVKVPQDPDYILEDEEVSTKAHDVVMTMANENGWNVSFIYVIYVESPDDMEGIV